MFDAKQTRPPPPSHKIATALSPRGLAPGDARDGFLRTVGRQLSRAIRRAVLACLLWRVAGYRLRHCTVRADGSIKSRRGTY